MQRLSTTLPTSTEENRLTSMPHDLQEMSILIVDDNEIHAKLLLHVLRKAGIKRVQTLDDPRLVIKIVQAKHPDLILLDMSMPHMSGLEVMQKLKACVAEQIHLPIIVLTADDSAETRQKVLAEGAVDFLNKPFDETEVCLRVSNHLRTRHYYLELEKQRDDLEQRFRERTHQLEVSHVEMLTRLARVGEYRDDESNEHIWRVAKTTSLIAKEIGLGEAKVDLLLRAARLHDVGKIAIPDGILYKPGKLSTSEFEVIKTHTTIGAEILSGGQSELLRVAEVIALSHHERWDGTGYPLGLRGNEIPVEGRILAIADTFDALTHAQPHRGAFLVKEAVEEIQREQGKQFDPQLVEAFLKLYWAGKVPV